jgi:hypothetical protein
MLSIRIFINVIILSQIWLIFVTNCNGITVTNINHICDSNSKGLGSNGKHRETNRAYNKEKT